MISEHIYNNKSKLIEYLTELAVTGEYVFRGYSIQEQMLPSIIRNRVTDVENELLTEFERYGSQYISVNNYIDLMSYAQHFGLSTRLLDFTFNPFIALYFSLFKAKSYNATEPDDRMYYYIRYAKISENDFRTELKYKAVVGSTYFDTSTDTWAEKAKLSFEQLKESANNSELTSILFVDPNQSNQRLVMQQGLFMFPYTLDEKQHRDIINSNTTVIKIHKDLREDMQSYLDTIGINAFRMMPDLSSVCEAVERKVKEKRNKKSELFKAKAIKGGNPQ